MAIEVADTFTEASADTALTSHTPDTGGGTWSVGSGNWQVRFVLDVVNTDVRDHAWLSNVASSADVYCQATGAVISTFNSRYFGAGVRHTGFARGNASCNSYFNKLDGAGNMALIKEVAGTETQLGSNYAVPSFSAATEYTIRVEADGDQISALIGGAVQIGPITDTAITAAGKYGIHARNSEPLNSSMEGGTLGGAITETVNQVTETDTSQSMTAAKRLSIGQLSETDLAQALSVRKIALVGQAQETDTAQPITHTGPKIISVEQVSETDLARPITPVKVRAVGQITETDTALSLSHLKRKGIAQATETDTALAITSNMVGVGMDPNDARTLIAAARIRTITAGSRVRIIQANPTRSG